MASYFARFLLPFCFSCSVLYAQQDSPVPHPQENKPAGITTKDLSKLYKSATKQRVNSGRFVYQVYLKDSSTIKVNSNIFKDKISGKHFVYYSGKDSVMRIFPSQTIMIAKQNPFDRSADNLIGMPSDSCWRFELISGKISAYSFMLNETRIDEIRFENGSIEQFDPEKLEMLTNANETARSLYLQGSFYSAIKKLNE